MKKKFYLLGFIALVAIMGFTVLACGEEDTAVLTEEQEEFKAELLEEWAEFSEDQKAAAGNAFRIFGLPQNPQSWSNSNWIKFYDLSVEDKFMWAIAGEITFMWNAGDDDRAEVVEIMDHFKSEHGLSSGIPNNPNEWTKAHADLIFAAFNDCDHM